MKTVHIYPVQFDNGRFGVSFGGVILGDSRKFDSAAEAMLDASRTHPDGSTRGKWESGQWVETMFIHQNVDAVRVVNR